LHDCTRIPLTHPLQSLDWLGIGQHLFLATVATRIQDLTLYWDISVVGTPSKCSESTSRNSEICSPGNPRKPPTVTLINAAVYFHASNLKTQNVSNSGSLSRDHWSFHDHIRTPVDMNSVPEDYHDFMDMFSKSKARKLASHRPYDLKITLDKGTAPPLDYLLLVSGGTCGSV